MFNWDVYVFNTKHFCLFLYAYFEGVFFFLNLFTKIGRWPNINIILIWFLKLLQQYSRGSQRRDPTNDPRLFASTLSAGSLMRRLRSCRSGMETTMCYCASKSSFYSGVDPIKSFSSFTHNFSVFFLLSLAIS